MKNKIVSNQLDLYITKDWLINHSLSKSGPILNNGYPNLLEGKLKIVEENAHAYESMAVNRTQKKKQ